MWPPHDVTVALAHQLEEPLEVPTTCAQLEEISFVLCTKLISDNSSSSHFWPSTDPHRQPICTRSSAVCEQFWKNSNARGALSSGRSQKKVSTIRLDLPTFRSSAVKRLASRLSDTLPLNEQDLEQWMAPNRPGTCRSRAAASFPHL